MVDNRSLLVYSSRRFDASPERVFDAWLTPELADKWLFTPEASEHQGTRVEIDPRVGGTWTIRDVRDGQLYVADGEYLEIDRPHLLVVHLPHGPVTGKTEPLTPEEIEAGLTQMAGAREGGWDAMFHGPEAAVA